MSANDLTYAERLEYLRGEIRAERISYGEIAELHDLADLIDPSDVELLGWVDDHGPGCDGPLNCTCDG